MPLPDIKEITVGYGHATVQKYYFVACSVVLFWDIGITYGKEVEFIWKQRWTPFTFLWFLLRYIPPLMEIVILESLFDPAWTPHAWLPFAGSFSVVCVALVQSVFALRIYALYGGKKSFLFVFVLFLAGEAALMGFVIYSTVAVPTPPGMTGCAGGAKSFGSRAQVAFWAPSFIFDAIVFGMTMYKSYTTVKGNRSLGVLNILLRDGSLYFFCVFFINIANYVTVLRAPDDLNIINVNLVNNLPVVITTRLILNLKSIARRRDVSLASRNKVPFELNNRAQLSVTPGHTPTSLSFSTLVGVLGEPGHRPISQMVTTSSEGYGIKSLA